MSRVRKGKVVSEYEFVWCRTFGHSWEEWRSDRVPQWGYYESVYCTVCSMERLFTIAANGKVISRRYIAPEGYKMKIRVSRAEMRIEMRKRGWWQEEAKAREKRTA